MLLNNTRRFRPGLVVLEARLCPSFDHLAYAQDLFHRMPWVVQGTVHSAGSSEYGDIRPIWNARLTDNAELAHLRGTPTDYAHGTMARSPWTGRLTVYYLVDYAATPAQVCGLVGHEMFHWFDWAYREVYYGHKASESAWFDRLFRAWGPVSGISERQEAFAIWSECYVMSPQSYGNVPDLNDYFANLYGYADTIVCSA
jgi:hypothetical protein